MSCTSVVRIGPFLDENECAKNLRVVIQKHFLESTIAACGNGDDDDERRLVNGDDATTYQIRITNRYFSANIQLMGNEEDVPSSTTTGSATGNTTSTTATTTTYAEDGMILVFDAERSRHNYAASITSSFDTIVGPIHNQAVKDNKCGELLRLCVSIGNNRAVYNGNNNGMTQKLSEKEYEEEYSRRIIWCLDHGYEYIEVPDLLETTLLQGHDVRDKDGFARIIEAISGTVWTSAIMESKQQQQLQQSFAETRKDIVDTSSSVAGTAADVIGTSTTTSMEDVADNDNGSYEPPNPMNFESSIMTMDENDLKERERQAHEALLSECTMNETTTTTAVLDATTTNDTKLEELQQERAMHTLETSLNEARRIRELSKSGQLSDDERRKRAGDAAILLMKTMEQMGFMDDDEEEDDEDHDDKMDKKNSLVEDGNNHNSIVKDAVVS